MTRRDVAEMVAFTCGFLLAVAGVASLSLPAAAILGGVGLMAAAYVVSRSRPETGGES